MTYLGTSIEMVKQGLAFAFIPRSHIEKELSSGELKELTLAMAASREMAVSRVFVLQEQANPAVQEVARYIDQAFLNHSADITQKERR